MGQADDPEGGEARGVEARRPRWWPRRLPLILSVLAGMLLGSSLFVLNYAEGLAYLSNDPEACTNCHIMQPQFDAWQRAPHAAVAVCNDCHTPHDLVGKYVTKARNGWNHSVAFTLQNFDEPIRIKSFNEAIVEENCRECHEALVNQITGHYGAEDQELDCVRCHRGGGHALSG
jgi:cytochrome c nitrite reductase small subunit